MTMTRPHEAMGFNAPIGRRLPSGLAAWNILFLACSLVFSIGYVICVNATAASSYRVSESEKRVEVLRAETMAMQDKLASLSSLQELVTKASGNGYVPVETIEFVNIGTHSYARK